MTIDIIYLDKACVIQEGGEPYERMDELQAELKRKGYLMVYSAEEIPQGIEPDRVLCISNRAEDMPAAHNAGRKFGLALWGCASVRHTKADYYFIQPFDVLNLLDTDPQVWDRHQWLAWAIELQFIGQAGITYSKDPFDLERFARIREIAAQILHTQSGVPLPQVREVFCNETGFQTPKMDTRAAIFWDGRILLVKERDGTWSMPGGWVDVNQSIRTNTVKEVEEEAGLCVVPSRLIAVQDRNLHNTPPYAYGILKAFVQCEIVDGQFVENIETQESRFFGPDELPELADEKNTAEQVRLCFLASQDPGWVTIFD
ncbi:NUDIX hydrolase N-terminal domain-containing protein [Diplocloster hominis]|uniref:NUDIX hydrolase N-terminal domain-containing protein n=1 Tax=Diplocloster hominis TaxID=3079010 RepID=UPI0031B9DBBE